MKNTLKTILLSTILSLHLTNDAFSSSNNERVALPHHDTGCPKIDMDTKEFEILQKGEKGATVQLGRREWSDLIHLNEFGGLSLMEGTDQGIQFYQGSETLRTSKDHPVCVYLYKTAYRQRYARAIVLVEKKHYNEMMANGLIDRMKNWWYSGK